VDEQEEISDEWLLDIQRDPAVKVDPSLKRACPRCDGIKLKRHFFSAKKQVDVDLCRVAAVTGSMRGSSRKSGLKKPRQPRWLKHGTGTFPWKRSDSFIAKSCSSIRLDPPDEA